MTPPPIREALITVESSLRFNLAHAKERVAELEDDVRELKDKLSVAQQVAVPQGWADAVNIARNLHRYPKEDSITPHGIRMLIAAILGADEVFTAAPQPPQAERVPMTEEELEDGFNSPSVDVAPTDTVESVFAEGARFAERHHGIGAKP